MPFFEKHYAYIDALRGYAILGVIAAHTSQYFPGWSGLVRNLVDQGARGVELFFLASALTLMISWNSRQDGARNFYIRRLFRIAPMFWLGLILYVALHGLAPQYWSPNGNDRFSIAATALFVHGWSPAYFNAVVPGGWSIGVEMSFYLIFPLLAVYFRDQKRALLGVFVSLMIAHFSFQYAFEFRHVLWPDVSHDYLTWNLVNLWFPNELPVFMTGIYLYFVIQGFAAKQKISPIWIRETLLLVSLSMMIFLAERSDPYMILHGALSLYAAFGFAFGLFAFSLAIGAGKVLINPVITLLGKVSFSAYLWHFAVLEIAAPHLLSAIKLHLGLEQRPALGFVLLLLTILMVTGVLAWGTYRLIEKPMMSAGNRLILGLKRSSW